MKKNPYLWSFVIIIIVSIGMITIAFIQKAGLHVDEGLTYLLANFTEGTETEKIPIESGVKYIPKDFFAKYMASTGFELKHVWLNQERDVHPPLYYLLIHAVSTVWKNIVTVRPGFIINVFFHVINLIVLFKLSSYLLKKKEIALMVCSLYAVSALIVDSVTFARMYVMLTTWFLLILLLHFIYWIKKPDKYFYFGIILLSVCGALTHYYYILWLFFIGLLYGIRLLVSKKWKTAAFYAMSMGIAGIMSIAIFPAMLKHIFGGYRSVDSINKLKDLKAYGENLIYFGKIIDKVSGGVWVVLFIFIILLIVMNKAIEGRMIIWIKELIKGGWILVIFPVVLYYLAISKIAIYNDDRYISPIYPFIVILTVSIVFWIIQLLLQRKLLQDIIMLLLIAVMIVNSYNNYEFRYSYSNHKEIRKISSGYSNYDCIYFFNGGYKTLTDYYEINNLQSVTFYQCEDLEDLSRYEIEHSDNLIVYIQNTISDQEGIMNYVLSLNSNFDGYYEMYDSDFASAYLLR